ncbi:MAG: N-acetyltransferase family protein [Ilumatobacteraceae bacterium]|nr:N-acetyltransferase [Ilumatobacter sp.]MCO5330883.1 N-acetyltransferase family protein [Ilumatobacteraceae bacterium]
MTGSGPGATPAALVIRDATADDMAAVCALYNALVATTTVAWTEEPEPLHVREAWFAEQQRDGHPVLVADVDREVVGFASYGSFRGEGKWPGYRLTVEHTIHVGEGHWGGGIGRALMDMLVSRARANGLHVMVGAVDGANDASLRFHERLGFTEVARMPEVGIKFGRWLDLVLVQRVL